MSHLMCVTTSLAVPQAGMHPSRSGASVGADLRSQANLQHLDPPLGSGSSSADDVSEEDEGADDPQMMDITTWLQRLGLERSVPVSVPGEGQVFNQVLEGDSFLPLQPPTTPKVGVFSTLNPWE